MKNVLLSTAAVAGLALAAISPAAAQDGGLKLGVSGFMAGYAVYTDEDDTGTSYRSFDFRKSSEVALTGETTLENGLTVGAYLNMLTDRADDTDVEQSYMYASGQWGRVNFGETDGAAYLLQVAAPSADDMVDGIDPEINTFINDADTDNGFDLGYKHAFTDAFANKFTYMTPVFNGFQAAATYTPGLGDADESSVGSVNTDNDAELGDAYEVAARYQGSFQPMDLTVGAGYSTAEQETTGEDQEIMNVGAVVTVGNINVGAAYKNDNQALADDNDKTVWVAGADYRMGAYKLGLSYQDYTEEQGTGNADEEAQRYTAGATYDFGPGMSFRGSVSYVDRDNGTAADTDATQVAVGTVVNF